MKGLCLPAGAHDWDHFGAQSWEMVLLLALGTAWCVLFPLAPGPCSPAVQAHIGQHAVALSAPGACCFSQVSGNQN